MNNPRIIGPDGKQYLPEEIATPFAQSPFVKSQENRTDPRKQPIWSNLGSHNSIYLVRGDDVIASLKVVRWKPQLLSQGSLFLPGLDHIRLIPSITEAIDDLKPIQEPEDENCEECGLKDICPGYDECDDEYDD